MNRSEFKLQAVLYLGVETPFGSENVGKGNCSTDSHRPETPYFSLSGLWRKDKMSSTFIQRAFCNYQVRKERASSQ